MAARRTSGEGSVPPRTSPPDRPPLLELRDLEVEFSRRTGAVAAVSGATLTVHRGESVAIVGESGSGKSTLIAAAMGLLASNGRVVKGEIIFGGEDITRASEARMRAIRGARIGFVPQDPLSSLNPVTRIGVQVEEALQAHTRTSGREASARAAELMTHVGLTDVERRARQYPHEFSGGMRQRVLIAMGLACGPDLVIADEPTSALDVTVQRQILDHLQTLTRDSGTAVLLVTHDLALAAERAERVVVMYQGRIVEVGAAEQILNDPQDEYTKKLLASAPSLASARMRPSPAAPGGGTATAPLDPGARGADHEAPILEVRSLRKSYRVGTRGQRGRTDFLAVDDVSFSVGRGKTLAIVGESGSGKTTTARMMLGLVEPTSGSVRFDGQDVTRLDKAGLRRFRRRVQAVFQDPYSSLNPTDTIERIIGEPLHVHGIGDAGARRRRVHGLLEQVALPTSVLRRHPNELSGGQRQRVAIARALAVGPDLIVCDEPVSALDVLVQAQILSLLTELQRELGLTYLFISHDLAVVRLIADQVAVMQAGKVVENRPTEELFVDPREEYTRRLLAAIPGRALLTA